MVLIVIRTGLVVDAAVAQPVRLPVEVDRGLNSLLPDFDTALTIPPVARPNSAE